MTLNQPQRYLPDTNILIHLGRQSALSQEIANLYPLAPGDPTPILSSIIVGEIQAFAQRSKWGQTKRQIVDDFISRCLVVPLEHPGIIEAYVELENYSRTVGRTTGDHDLWIAATARVMGATLLTTDKDFDHLSPVYIQRVWINPVTP